MLPGKAELYGVNWINCPNALESGRVIVTGSVSQMARGGIDHVSMPWKAGGSLLQRTLHPWNQCHSCLNALESGRVIVTELTCREGILAASCLNALESGRVIVTDPILEAGGSRARKPRIANLPS